MGLLCKYRAQSLVATSYTAAYTDFETRHIWNQANAMYSWQSVPEAAPPKYKNHDQGLLCSITKTLRITLNRSSSTRKSSFSTRQYLTMYTKMGYKKTVRAQLRTLTKSILFYFFPFIRQPSFPFAEKLSFRKNF